MGPGKHCWIFYICYMIVDIPGRSPFLNLLRSSFPLYYSKALWVFKGQQRKPAAFVLHTERLTIKHIYMAKNRFHPHTALWEITIFGNNHAQYPHKISNPPKETVTLLCPGLVYSMTPLSLSRVRTEQLLFSGSGNKKKKLSSRNYTSCYI